MSEPNLQNTIQVRLAHKHFLCPCTATRTHKTGAHAQWGLSFLQGSFHRGRRTADVAKHPTDGEGWRERMRRRKRGGKKPSKERSAWACVWVCVHGWVGWLWVGGVGWGGCPSGSAELKCVSPWVHQRLARCETYSQLPCFFVHLHSSDSFILHTMFNNTGNVMCQDLRYAALGGSYHFFLWGRNNTAANAVCSFKGETVYCL